MPLIRLIDQPDKPDPDDPRSDLWSSDLETQRTYRISNVDDRTVPFDKAAERAAKVLL